MPWVRCVALTLKARHVPVSAMDKTESESEARYGDDGDGGLRNSKRNDNRVVGATKKSRVRLYRGGYGNRVARVGLCGSRGVMVEGRNRKPLFSFFA
jgi:hypothetical protein